MPLDPAILFSAVLNGLTTGAVYALVALGLTLIYGVLHIINFAHGAALMVALYAVYLLNQRLGLDPYAALPLVMAGMFALGYLLQRLVINRASHGKDENILLVTLGLSIVLENLALVWFKSDTRSIDTPYALSTVEIGPALIALPADRIRRALAVAACLLWLIRGTDLRAIRAVAREKQGARLMGIDVERVYALSFGIGMACLGAAACFLLPAYYVNPQVGGGFVLVAFTIVVLGGMGSFAGALAGGLLIGVVESLGGLFLGDSLGQMGIFAIFILVLLFHSQGLFGGKHEHERQGRLRHPGLRPGGAGHHRVHAVGRAADLHHDVVVRGAAVAGLEHPGRLRRPAVLRPCAVLLRRGRLCPALGQLSLGWNPWLALPCAIALGMAAGWPWAG